MNCSVLRTPTILIQKQRMCLGTFSRLRRSLAISTLYAAVRILAERFFTLQESNFL